MKPIFLPYENHEALSAEQFFRDLVKAETDDSAVLDESPRSSDLKPHPLAKMFGEQDTFDRPAVEQRTELQKRTKVVETQIGSSIVVAELDEHDVVMRTFLKGAK